MIGMTMDKELLHMVAEAAGSKAASEIVVELRQEIADQFSTMKDDFKAELKADMKSYFGQLPPDQHIIQHDRFGRFLKWADDFQGKLWGKIAMGVLIAGVGALVIVWLLGKSIGG